MAKNEREGALTPLLKEFGAHLKSLRRRAGLKQEQVAEAVGKSKQAVSNWEAGRHEMSQELLEELGRLYRATPDELTPRLAVPAEVIQETEGEDLAAFKGLGLNDEQIADAMRYIEFIKGRDGDS